MLERLCAEGGFAPTIAYTIAYTIADVAIVRAIIAAGLAIAIMGEDTIAPADSGVVLRSLPCDERPARTILAVWLRNRRVPSAERMLPVLVDTAGAHIRQCRAPETSR